MAGKEKNFGDKINTNGFDKRPKDAANGGRPVSIKKEMINLLGKDGRVTIPSSQVLQVKDDGSVVLRLPTQQQLAMKLISIAMGSGNQSIRALLAMIDHVDGRAVQKVEDVTPGAKMTKQEIEEKIKNLIDKDAV